MSLEKIDLNKLGAKWLIIGTTPHPKMGFTDRQLVKTLQSQGVEVYYVDMTSISQLPQMLKENKFKVIYWEAINGWKVWDQIKDYQCKKINTWFDDPIMRIDMAGISETMRVGTILLDPQFSSKYANGTLSPVQIFCWDSYWSDRLLLDYGIDSETLHLAANPKEYYTADLACESNPVFIGALHSPRKLDQMAERLCDPFKTFIKSIKEELKKDHPPIPWDQLESHYLSILGDGEMRLYTDLAASDRSMHSFFRQCIWGLSKNAVRVNMLRAALKVSPVTMFAETEQVNHAKEGELRAMIGDGEEKLKFVDTTGVSQERLPMFYHWGWVHLQATDPQSVYQGYPYRVFQTMAAGKCLLTDTKRDWCKDFALGQDMVAYDSLSEMQEKLNSLINNKSMCKEIGKKARETFENNHTWQHRIDRMMK